MKAFALMLLFAGCLLLGREKASRCGDRLRLLTQLSAFVRTVRDSIAYAALSPDEILRRAAGRQDLRGASFLEKLSPEEVAREGFSSPWHRTVASLPLKEEERELLLSWGESLGKSDRDSQLLNCDNALRRLTEWKQTASEETEKQRRMWLSLGVIGGAFAVVMAV